MDTGKPFGKAVAETYRGIKQDFEGKPEVDPQVREQINSDFDRLIEKNEGVKSWPVAGSRDHHP